MKELSLYNTLLMGFVLLVALQRLFEVALSKRNEKIILEKGGREHRYKHNHFMKAVHTLWILAILFEIYWFEPSFSWFKVIFLFIFLCGQILRYAAIRELGWRWNIKILTIPGAQPVTGGIFKYLRHPNYLGVILEIISLPLLCHAYFSAAIFTVLNGWVLFLRIRAEEQALNIDNDYQNSIEAKTRLLFSFSKDKISEVS